MHITALHYGAQISNLMKKIILVLLFLLPASVYLVKAQDVNADPNQDLYLWLQKIPVGNESLYGFSDRAEFALASVGNPIEVFTVDFTDLQNYKNVNLKLVSTHEWRVPVIVNGSCRALLTVVESPAGKIVDLGGKVLATEIDQKARVLGERSRYLKLVRIFQVHSDFLLTMDSGLTADQLELIPMNSALINLPELASLKEGRITLQNLAPIILNNASPEN